MHVRGTMRVLGLPGSTQVPATRLPVLPLSLATYLTGPDPQNHPADGPPCTEICCVAVKPKPKSCLSQGLLVHLRGPAASQGNGESLCPELLTETPCMMASRVLYLEGTPASSTRWKVPGFDGLLVKNRTTARVTGRPVSQSQHLATTSLAYNSCGIVARGQGPLCCSHRPLLVPSAGSDTCQIPPSTTTSSKTKRPYLQLLAVLIFLSPSP